VADNIVATIRNQPKRVFAFKTLGKLAGLGQRSAVAEILGVKMSGLVAWFMWRMIYWMKMPGLDRKIRVAVDWFLDFFLHPDIVQLKTEQAPGVRREHFDKGEVVFREGDRGDRLYIIVEGEVDVVREVDGQGESHLATLGPGACFGEVALVEDRPRNATVRSRASLNVLTVDRPAFEQLFAHLPPLRTMFQQMIDERSHRSSPSPAPATDKTG
jgi:NADH dehydrogenase